LGAKYICLYDILSRLFYAWPVARTKAESAEAIPLPDDKAFGRRLKEIRKRRGVSQVDLAQRLGIHQSLVSQYECGYLRLHGALLVRLAQALQTTPDEILAVKTTPGDDHPLDRRFLRRIQKVDKLSTHDQKTLLRTIDAFLKSSRAS
jgi:transcriptional regulator with XRE-family HTH domain